MDEEQMKMAEELLFTGEEKPSFAKMLYFGAFDGARVFPFPDTASAEEDQAEKVLQELKVFAESHIDGGAIDREAAIPASVLEGLGKMGVLGFTVPPKFGGLGLSQYSYCRAMEEIARHCGSTALFVNAHHSIGQKALLLFGTDAQQQRWLPGLASGEKVAAFSLTEPTAGSDAAGVQTRAVYDPEKKVYRINGQKQWTTNGGIADVLTVMARTEIETPNGIEDKITAFLVTPDMKGFKVLNKALEKVGMRGTMTANLAFEDMEVPEENILGPKGAGLRVCLTVLDYGRTTFGATCTGAAKFLVERAIEHAKSRQQFKRPLASFSLVKKKIAEMSALAYAMESTTYLTAGLVDRGQEDIMLESAMLKVFNSDALWNILYDTMQIFGGRSFFTDAPYERMMRDARLNMIGEGSNEVMRAFIGVVGMRDVGMQLQKVMEAAKSPVKGISTLFGFGRVMLSKTRVPQVPVKSELLKDEAQALGKAVRKFGLAIPGLLGKYREQVVEQQLALDRVATIGMAIYTTTAVLSRLDRDLARVGGRAEALGNDVTVAKYYCHRAFQTIEECLAGLKKNADKETEKVADLITSL